MTRQELDKRYKELEDWLASTVPTLAAAIRPAVGLVVIDETQLAKELTDEGLRRFGALVKVCCRYGATVVVGNSSRWMIAEDPKKD